MYLYIMVCVCLIYLSKMIYSHLLCGILVVYFIHNLDFSIVIPGSKSSKLNRKESQPTLTLICRLYLSLLKTNCEEFLYL